MILYGILGILFGSMFVIQSALAASVVKYPLPPPSTITRVAPPGITPLAPKLVEPKIAFDTNVRVNANPMTLTQPQVEPSVASNPMNPLQLVAGFADALDDPVVFDFTPGIPRSIDGGRTWSAPIGGAIVPDPPGFQWGSRTLATHLAAGDSAVAWGIGDTVYFSTLGFHDNRSPPNNNCASGGLYVYQSDDGGNSWTLPANGPAISNTQNVFRDKEYIAADANPESPFAGNLYMVWDDDVYSGCPQDFGVNFLRRDISFSVSSDGGATWSEPMVLATGCLVTPVPAVAANGDLFVAWYDCNQGIRQMVSKSIDGGLSFGPAAPAASNLTPPPNPLIGSAFRVNAALPAIATDPTNANHVYVTWSSDNGSSQTDVFVSRSLDGGITWSATPVRVNDDSPGNPRDQFFPWIAVSAESIVCVMWGDDRLDLVNPGGKLYDIFMAESIDQRGSFGPNIRVIPSLLIQTLMDLMAPLLEIILGYPCLEYRCGMIRVAGIRISLALPLQVTLMEMT